MGELNAESACVRADIMKRTAMELPKHRMDHLSMLNISYLSSQRGIDNIWWVTYEALGPTRRE